MQDFFAVQYSWLIPLPPHRRGGGGVCRARKWLKGRSYWPIWIGVGLAAIISISLIIQMAFAQPDKDGILQVSQHVYWWIQLQATLKSTLAISSDPLTAVMLCVVCGITAFSSLSSPLVI